MNDGATRRDRGSAGWGSAEGMLTGTVVVDGNAGNGAAASIRGGTVVVRGDCAARAGVAMKGGLLLIAGDAGYMTGFMMQKGVDRHLRRRRRGAGRLDVRRDGLRRRRDRRARQRRRDRGRRAPTTTAMLERCLRDATTSPRPADASARSSSGRKLWNFEQARAARRGGQRAVSGRAGPAARRSADEPGLHARRSSRRSRTRPSWAATASAASAPSGRGRWPRSTT